MSDNVLQSVITEYQSNPDHTYPRFRDLIGAFGVVLQGVHLTVELPGGGTPKAIDVYGYPRFAIVVNDNLYVTGIKIRGMSGAYAVKVIPGGAVSKTDNMITLADGTLTVGSDGDLNTNHNAHIFYAV